MKKSILLLVPLLSILGLISCSNDNEDYTKNDSENALISSFKKNDYSNSIKKFAESYYKLYKFTGANPVFFEDFKPENYKINNDTEFMAYAIDNKLNNLNVLNELIEIYPIVHKDFKEIVELEMKEIQTTDINLTPAFILFKTEVGNLQLAELISTYGSKKECLEDWNNGRADCNEDAIAASALSIIAAAGGIWPGLISAAGTMYAYNRCIAHNDRDYSLCIKRG